jgi:hypothetical protein
MGALRTKRSGLACNWLRVSLGRQICLKAAAKLDFQPLSPDRVKSGVVQRLPFSGYAGARKQLACEALAEIEGCPVVRRPASPVQARRG